MSAKEELIQCLGDVALATKLDALDAINFVLKRLLEEEVSANKQGTEKRPLTEREILTAFTIAIDGIIERETKQLNKK